VSIPFDIAIRAVPFLDLLDGEVEALAAKVLESSGGTTEAAAMDATRRRLAQGVDAFVRSLPAVVRNDVNTSRLAAYTLVGLVDERMLHYPAGGLERWREHLLEFELYGSALAGQEIVGRARAATYGTVADLDNAQAGGAALLAPLYLAVFRSGFEGSLRGDVSELNTLISSLEETVSTGRPRPVGVATGERPPRLGVPAAPLAAIGVSLWLACGFTFWLVLSSDTLHKADQVADRIAAGLPVIPGAAPPLERSIGPSGLPPLEDQQAASER